MSCSGCARRHQRRHRRAGQAVVPGLVRERRPDDRIQGDRAAGVALYRGEPEGQGQPRAEHELVSRVASSRTRRRRCSKQEKRLEDYKKQYAGQLPSQAESNQQAIQNAQLQLQTVGQTDQSARERRLLVQQQLVGRQTRSASGCRRWSPTGRPVAGLVTAAQQLESGGSGA